MDDDTLKKVVLHSVATALASMVLPVPGGPNISTPCRGGQTSVHPAGGSNISTPYIGAKTITPLHGGPNRSVYPCMDAPVTTYTFCQVFGSVLVSFYPLQMYCCLCRCSMWVVVSHSVICINWFLLCLLSPLVSVYQAFWYIGWHKITCHDPIHC